MKKDSINKIKLGIFVALGIAIFAAGIFFIGETRKLFSTTFRVSALFIDVNGLQVGNNVRFAGINVGSIEGIQIISDSSVKVDLIIDESTRKFIKKDSKATIGSEGMMGNKLIVITPGSVDSPIVENNDRIGTIIPVNFDEMIGALKVTGDNAAKITGDIAAMLDDVRAGKGTAGKVLYDRTFARNLDNILINVDEGTAGLKNTFNPEFTENVNESMAKVNDILANVSESSDELKELMVEAKGSWLLGSFFGGSSDEDDAEKLKKEEEKKANLLKKEEEKELKLLQKELDANEKLLNNKTQSKEVLPADKKKMKEDEIRRLKRVKEIYDAEVLREKQEKKALEEMEKLKKDSLNKK